MTLRISPTAYSLLGFLSIADSPMSGYDLWQAIRSSIGHFWSANHSQIYAELRRLEAGRLVTAENVTQEKRPDKRVYVLTEGGRAALRDWLDAPAEAPYLRDPFALKLFFSHGRDRADVVASFRDQLAQHQERADWYGDLLSRIPMGDWTRYPRMTIEMGLYFERAYVGWLTHAITEMECT